MHAETVKSNDQKSSVSTSQRTKTPFFQPKLTINQPGDEYEQEADAVADRVMRMPANDDRSFFKSLSIPVSFLQKKCSACEEEEKLQRKEEELEEEAMIPGKTMFDLTVRRKCAECEDEEKKNVSRKEISAGDSAFENYVGNLNSSGKQLPESTRSFFEPRFGYDFSQVKIHTDVAAAESAKSVNAFAFTSGNDIVFNQNQFSPETDSGKKLLAHELTHVVQQKNETPGYSVLRSPAGEPDAAIDIAVVDDIDSELTLAEEQFKGSYDVALIVVGSLLDVYELGSRSNLGIFDIQLSSDKIATLIGSRSFGIFGFNTKNFRAYVTIHSSLDWDETEINETLSIDNWFATQEEREKFKGLVSGKEAVLFINKAAENVFDETSKSDEPPPEPAWLEPLVEKVNITFKNLRGQEPFSIDLPIKVEPYYDKRPEEQKWKWRAPYKGTDQETHVAFIDVKQRQSEQDVAEALREEIRSEIPRNYNEAERKSVPIDDRFRWAYELKWKLEAEIFKQQRRRDNQINDLPDQLALVKREEDPYNIYLKILVFSSSYYLREGQQEDDAITLASVEKYRLSEEQAKRAADAIEQQKQTAADPALQGQYLGYVPGEDHYVTLKSMTLEGATLPFPLRDDMTVETLLPEIKKYVYAYRHQNEPPDTSGSQYKTHLEAYPAVIRGIDVRSDFRSVTGANNSFRMHVDISLMEGDGIGRLVFFNPVFYNWDVFRLSDLVSEAEQQKMDPDWKIRRYQLLDYLNAKGVPDATPVLNENIYALMKSLDSDAGEGAAEAKGEQMRKYRKSGMYYSIVNARDDETEVPMPATPGDYVIFATAQFSPLSDSTIRDPSKAFYPIRLVDGNEFAESELNTRWQDEIDLEQATAAEQDTVKKAAMQKLLDRNLKQRTVDSQTEVARVLALLKKIQGIQLEAARNGDSVFHRLMDLPDQESEELLNLWSAILSQPARYTVEWRIEQRIKQLEEQQKGLKELSGRISEFDLQVDYSQPTYTPQMVLVSSETGQTYQLITFLGYGRPTNAFEYASVKAGKVMAVLIDVSTEQTETRYPGFGDTFEDATKDALSNFQDECKYGEGYVHYRIPPLSLDDKFYSEPGTLQKVLSILKALTLVAGIAAIIFSGGTLGLVLGVGSALLGAGLAAQNIADRVANHRFEWDLDAILDLVNIIAPFTMTISAITTISRVRLYGEVIIQDVQWSKAAGIIKLEKGIAIYQKIETGTNFFLINLKMQEDLSKINEMQGISEQKRNALKRQVISNGMLGNLMISTSMGRELSAPDEFRVFDDLLQSSADPKRYEILNIGDGIYNPDGTFNYNMAGASEPDSTPTPDVEIADTPAVIDQPIPGTPEPVRKGDIPEQPIASKGGDMKPPDNAPPSGPSEPPSGGTPGEPLPPRAEEVIQQLNETIEGLEIKAARGSKAAKAYAEVLKQHREDIKQNPSDDVIENAVETLQDIADTYQATTLTSSTSELLKRDTTKLIKGDEAAMLRLLKSAGSWEDLMRYLSYGNRNERSIAMKIKAYRDKIIGEIARNGNTELLGQPSENPESDIDLSFTGSEARDKMVAAELYMAQYGENWSKIFRINFYTEGRRLTLYRDVAEATTSSFETTLLKQTKLFTLAKMLQHAEGSESSTKRVEGFIDKYAPEQKTEIFDLARISPEEMSSKRDELLKLSDTRMKEFMSMDINDPKRAGLAQEITMLQMEINFYLTEAYIGPGALLGGLSSTVGSEAWNSRDLKSRPH